MITLDITSVKYIGIATGEHYPHANIVIRLNTLADLRDWMSIRTGTLRLTYVDNPLFCDMEFRTSSEGTAVTVQTRVSKETLLASAAGMQGKTYIEFKTPAKVELVDVYGTECLVLPEGAKKEDGYIGTMLVVS